MREDLAQQVRRRFGIGLCLRDGPRHRLRDGRAGTQCAAQQESFSINSAVVNRIVKAMNWPPESLLYYRGQLQAGLGFAPGRCAAHDFRFRCALLDGEDEAVDRIAEFKQLQMWLKSETGLRSDRVCLCRRKWCPMFPIESVDIRPLEPRDVHC